MALEIEASDKFVMVNNVCKYVCTVFIEVHSALRTRKLGFSLTFSLLCVPALRN